MLVRSRAPLRLGLAGGGTDVAPFCDLHGGFVLNATIGLFAHATLEPVAEGDITLRAADLGTVERYPAVFPLPTSGTLGLLAAICNRIFRDFNGSKPFGLKLTTYADVPAGSGLGSSSTLVVAVIKAFQEYMSLPLGEYEVAHLAYEIERIDMRLSGGKQDQYAATFGGFNFMEFYSDDRVIVNPLRVKNWILSELEASTLLYFGGASRSSARIIDDQRKNVKEGVADTLAAMHALKADAHLLKEAVLKGDFDAIAANLAKSWEQKKRTAHSVTNASIDATIEAGMRSGARAAKVSGAGGGGFIMFIVDPERRVEVRRTLEAGGGVVFGCQFTSEGTQGWRITSNSQRRS
jgi:D-glycero-alpha-D-manno-heptose-7-phosphate kinase